MISYRAYFLVQISSFNNKKIVITDRGGNGYEKYHNNSIPKFNLLKSGIEKAFLANLTPEEWKDSILQS